MEEEMVEHLLCHCEALIRFGIQLKGETECKHVHLSKLLTGLDKVF